MKKNFIALIATLGLLCVLTIGASANIYTVARDEAIQKARESANAENETPSGQGGYVTGEWIPIDSVNGNHSLNLEFEHTESATKPTQKTASQNVKVTVKKPTPQDTESAPQTSINAESASRFFTDVPRDSYYFDAVRWAVEKGITNGTSATTFSPGNTCTRAQVVTFFWRNAGQPEPSSLTNPFSDVPEGSYYYKAVLWAVERSVTNGTSATTFSPNQPCTYAHVVTFLWRLKAEDTETAEGAAWYVTPAAWANANGMLTGTNFAPSEPCPRSDIVTYLYRSRPERINVSMSVETGSDYLSYAVISAYDSDGNLLWTHTTGDCVEPHFSEIGTLGDQYLYVESESVVALDLHTGAARWENDDFMGYPLSSAGCAMGTNDVLYLYGFDGPAFLGIDMSGNTVGSVMDFSDDPYYVFSPDYIQRVDESHMSVCVYSPYAEDTEGKVAFLVDLRDFSYEGPFDEHDSRVAPRIAPYLSGAWMVNGERVSRMDVTQIGNLYLFDVSWKSGYRWSFSGKWENGAIRYTNGLYSHRDWEFEWGQSGSVRLSGDTLIWTHGEGADSESVEYVRFYDAPLED